ncbi:MAG: hypothetical protein EAZ14_04245 [Runella slithyformis]|nr:MAG: hypothetical protein EAZ14_04245 [Runella slithyformis]
MYLADLFDSVANFARQKSDVLDDLSPADLKRLDESLEQIKNGQTVPDSVIREKYKQPNFLTSRVQHAPKF